MSNLYSPANRQCSAAQPFRLMAVLLLASLATALCQTRITNDEFLSPDKSFSIRLLHERLPGAPEADNSTIQVLAGTRVLSQTSTHGTLTGVLWSPGDKYVAVNNRRARKGDYVWVFLLTNGAVLKKPQEISYDSFKENILNRILPKFPQYRQYTESRIVCTATEWKNPDELMVQTRIPLIENTEGRDTPLIILDDTCKASGSGLTLLSEEITLYKQ